MDPRVESAIRRACDQLGQDGEVFLSTVRVYLSATARLHPDVKLAKRPKAEPKAEPKAGQDGG